MTAHIKPDGDVLPNQKPNTDISQTYQKRNDEGAVIPENDHVASPLDEPAPTNGKPFGAEKPD